MPCATCRARTYPVGAEAYRGATPCAMVRCIARHDRGTHGMSRRSETQSDRGTANNGLAAADDISLPTMPACAPRGARPEAGRVATMTSVMFAGGHAYSMSL